MNKIDVGLLMGLQYKFPLSPAPFKELGKPLGLGENEVISRVKDYLDKRIIFRLGLQINYRSLEERSAALVALSVDKKEVPETVKVINGIKGVKHNYYRNCDAFNIWFTIKAGSFDELEERIKPAVNLPIVKDWTVLPTKRVYKINVKYDLHRGISWSESTIEPERVPTIKETGLDPSLVFDLERNFKPMRRPFEPIAEKHGVKEEKLLNIVGELTRRGVAKYFGAVLSSEKIGFFENAMVALKTSKDVASICKTLVEEFPQITHCIERITSPKWDYPAYVVLHARERAKILEVVNELKTISGVLEVKPIFSYANLKGS